MDCFPQSLSSHKQQQGSRFKRFASDRITHTSSTVTASLAIMTRRTHFSTCIVLFPLLLICINQVACNKTSTQTPSSKSTTDSRVELEEQFNTEPRQYFKISVAPTAIVSSSKRSMKQSVLNKRRSTSGQESNHAEQVGGKQKISNATLKKLLNQSILKATNGTWTNGNNNNKSSNFKFVFIQRATAAPSKSSSDYGTKSTTQAPSLAASVSKQLASTLYYSAAKIVGNLTSSAPSLSSLASQLVAQSLDQMYPVDKSHNGTVTSSGIKHATVSSNSIQPNENGQDIQRIQAQNSIGGSSLATTKKRVGASEKRRPSKIYNLPVKFVSNGQPNHVVFNTIKHHFAAIKNLQQAAGGQQTKRRKQQGANKSKGNSRLFYLPLKYMSNGRASKIISSRATHKANN